MQKFAILKPGKTQYLTESLFDHIYDIAHFVKDAQGRYVMVNMSFVSRLGLTKKEEVLGKNALELFPEPLGKQYLQQDQRIFKTGVGIHGRLELHLDSNHKLGWALTYKEPIFDAKNRVIAICGLSRDIKEHKHSSEDMERLSKFLEYIEENIEKNMLITEVAEMMKISTYLIDQKIKAFFGVTTGQYIVQMRIAKACGLLRSTNDSIMQIAASCGYFDQSALTRQFKKTTEMTPFDYRRTYQMND
jgi:PAS domain S-box-containing protein